MKTCRSGRAGFFSDAVPRRGLDMRPALPDGNIAGVNDQRG
jgi:hypothetical protein